MILLLLPLLFMTGCATAPPKNPNNLCSIFREKDDWYDAAMDVKAKWGVPPHVLFAILYQESSFRYDALPPRDYLLGFIPWGRVSSAYGYAQAKDDTWEDYMRETDNWGADRDDFDDALDFMGWYIYKSHQLTGLSKWDAYGQYLAYHEGWGGYIKKTYNKKPWLKKVARKVEHRAKLFAKQYWGCKDDLKKGFWDWF
nr:transglycosylase SLT domain-containing protein [Gallaecimonas mangrovi]